MATALKNDNDVVTAIITLEIPVMFQSNQLRGDIGEKIDEINKQEMILEENMKTLGFITWGQVSDILKHRIQAQEKLHWLYCRTKLLVSNLRRTKLKHYKRL